MLHLVGWGQKVRGGGGEIEGWGKDNLRAGSTRPREKNGNDERKGSVNDD